MGMGMGGQNGKKWVWAGIAKMDKGMSMGIGPSRAIPVQSIPAPYPPHIHPISNSYSFV